MFGEGGEEGRRGGRCVWSQRPRMSGRLKRSLSIQFTLASMAPSLSLSDHTERNILNVPHQTTRIVFQLALGTLIAPGALFLEWTHQTARGGVIEKRDGPPVKERGYRTSHTTMSGSALFPLIYNTPTS